MFGITATSDFVVAITACVLGNTWDSRLKLIPQLQVCQDHGSPDPGSPMHTWKSDRRRGGSYMTLLLQRMVSILLIAIIPRQFLNVFRAAHQAPQNKFKRPCKLFWQELGTR